MSTARERLLARLLTEFGDQLPAPDASLREIATRVGTSHPLLHYHFGSHAGLLTAMLVAQRAQDNEALRLGAKDASFAELVERIWKLYSAPQGMARIRGFFLVAGLAAQEPAAFGEFISSLDDLRALLSNVARRDGDSEERAHLRATVTLAALRGLLLQEVLAPGIPLEDALQFVLQIALDVTAAP